MPVAEKHISWSESSAESLTKYGVFAITVLCASYSFSLFNDNVLNDKVWGMYSGGGFIQIAIGIIILIVGILMLRWETGRGKRYS